MTSDFGLLFVCISNAGTWDIADVKSCPVTFRTLSDLSRDLGEWLLIALLSEFFYHFLSCLAENGLSLITHGSSILEPQLISHSPLQSLLASEIQHTSVLESTIRTFPNSCNSSWKKKNIYCLPCIFFLLGLTHTEGFCRALITNKSREFQAEGGTECAAWKGCVRGCLARSFSSSTVRNFLLEPLHMWP